MERYKTIDIISGEVISFAGSTQILYNYVDGVFIYGRVSTCKIDNYYNEGLLEDISTDSNLPVGSFFSKNLKKYQFYSNYLGKTILDFNISRYQRLCYQYKLGIGFPYHFTKFYEAVNSFELFSGKQVLRKEIVDFPLEKYLKYTFGLEFETSAGILPEKLCFEDGLIPLRDGSIKGNEYSTVVLEGKFGLNLLKQQLEDLRKYTRFDKECSLHIHLGGFPLDPEKIYNLYKVGKYVERELSVILPKYTFKTSMYKASTKDYCKILPSCSSFNSLYEYLTGRKFYGSLVQSHPNDIDRERKWNIHQRYHWLNLINLVCFKVNKTAEFRLLRPTYNLEKILFWLYTFNALLLYAENAVIPKTILDIYKEVYPEDIADMLTDEYYKVRICTEEQQNIGDYIGSSMDIESCIFDENLII